MATGIKLEANTRTAVQALRELDNQLRKLDRTMGQMKGVPSHVVERMAQLEENIGKTLRKGEAAVGVEDSGSPLHKGTKVFGSRKVAEGRLAKFQEELPGKLKEMSKNYDELQKTIEGLNQVTKENEALQRSGMQQVRQHTNALDQMNREYIDGIKHKRNIGIPLNKKEIKFLTDLNEKVRLAARRKRDLTAEEAKYASALRITGKRLEINNGLLKKNQTALEQLRLTVSRTRNITLLYAFAVRPLEKLFGNLKTTMVEYEKAMLGVQRVSQRMGVSQTQLSTTIEQFTSSGLLDVTEVSAALKTLLSTGIGLPKATQLLQAMADAAAFNRQGTLEMGQALVGAAQGYKNMNSRMVDNAGLTKNLNVILKEQAFAQGVAVKNMTEMEKKLAIADGLIKEGAMFKGDFARSVRTVSGAFSQQELAIEKVNRQLGKLLEKQELFSGFAKSTEAFAVVIRRMLMNDAEKEFDMIKTLTANAGLNVDPKFSEKATKDEAFAQAKMYASRYIDGVDLHFERFQYDFGHKYGTRGIGTAEEQAEAMMRQVGIPSLDQVDRSFNDYIGSLGGILLGDNFTLDKSMQGRALAGETALEGRLREIEEFLDKQKTNFQKISAGVLNEFRKTDDMGILESFLPASQAYKTQIANLEALRDALRNLLNVGKEAPKLPENATAVLNQSQTDALAKLEEKLKRLQDQFEEGALSAPGKAIKRLEKDLEALNRQLAEFPEVPRVKALIDGFKEIYGLQQGQTIQGFIESSLRSTQDRPKFGSSFEGERQAAIDRVTASYQKQFDTINELMGLEKTTQEQRGELLTLRAELELRAALERGKALSDIDQKFTQEYEKARAYVNKVDMGANAKLIQEKNKTVGLLVEAERKGFITSEELNREIVRLNKETNEAITENYRKEADKRRSDRLKELNEQIAHLTSFSNSMTKIMRAMDRMSNGAARNAAAIVSSAGRAAAAIQLLNEAKRQGSALGQIAQVASLVETGVSLASTLFGKDDETQERKEREARRRNRQFGSTINRGPQTLYLTPTLVVNADGDVIFSEDGLEVVQARQLELLQQAVDGGEIAMPTEETYR